MDIRPFVFLCLATTIAVIAAETPSDDTLSNMVEEPSQDDMALERILGYDDLSKRGTMLRYGRGSMLRYGKRPSTFRYGKRGVRFRYGKRGDESAEEDTMEKRRMLFRYGKRSEFDLGEMKRGGSRMRYGRDLRRQKVHKPFRFGREMEQDA